MKPTEIVLGMQVKDIEGNVNYGLPMTVIDDNPLEVMVGYHNLDGKYQEGWLKRDTVVQVNKK